jgi:transposase
MRVLRNTKKTVKGSFRKKWRGVLLHNNARPHTAARIRALLEHFNWELFDRPPYSPDLAPSDYRLFTYVKYWLRSQRFSNKEELMEGVKTWLCSQAADTDIQNLFSDEKSASIQAITTLKSSLSVYVFLYIIKFVVLVTCFVNSSPDITL